MRSYNFRMEKILDYRQKIEKDVSVRFAEAAHRLERQKKKLDTIHREYEKASSDRHGDVPSMQMQFLYKEKLRSQYLEQEKKIEETAEELEDIRKDLLEATKDRKIMERLKEKDRDRFETERKNQQQKELDEIAVLKHQGT
ncbi:MAG TPA: flagellar export protein FliJ [Eubacteriaceae bacterium]|nr:flagellar export protein FliJ [Eubacteriaceae bacterium]